MCKEIWNQAYFDKSSDGYEIELEFFSRYECWQLIFTGFNLTLQQNCIASVLINADNKCCPHQNILLLIKFETCWN